MQYEVEQKHPVSDVPKLLERLAERGAEVGPPVDQADHYYAHPCRDFAQTDEALRIRIVGDKSFVTYKGPKLDTTTKTRHEIELPLDSNDERGTKFAELLQSLGFKLVAVVRKRRSSFQIDVSDRPVKGALDHLEGIGTFVELELMADEAGMEEAKQVIAKLAAELQLGPSERRSYLEIMLQKLAMLVSN